MRPFYVIGHNTNSIENVREVLEAGANAVEPDVQWNGDDLIIAHDPGTSGPPAREFLMDLGDIARRSRQFCLVVLDCKISGALRGRRLVRYAREAFAGTNVHIIYSVANLGNASLFHDICDQLSATEGLMVDQKDEAASKMDWLWRRGAARACFGDDNVPTAIDHGVALKVQSNLPLWVYTYTLGSVDQLRDAVRSGVDGIIVHDRNVIDLLAVVHEAEFTGKIRLATQADHPFQLAAEDRHGYTVSVQTLTRSGAGTDSEVTVSLENDQGHRLSTTSSGKFADRFEQGSLNEISLYGDIGIPSKVTIEHDGSGGSSRWLPDWVHVRRTDDKAVYAASLGDWIGAGVATPCRLGTSRYRLTVFTGDVGFAGTDADIVFRLGGASGTTVQRRVNGDDDSLFERNAIDDVYIAGIDIGPLHSLAVTNDGSGAFPGWFLDRVDVFKDDEGAVTFHFNRWINSTSVETVNIP